MERNFGHLGNLEFSQSFVPYQFMLFVCRFLLSLSHPTLLAPRDEMDLNHDCFVYALI